MDNFCVVKWDPVKVASDMETMTINGSYVFNNDECLTQAQIKSYFSRLAAKQRSMKRVADQQSTPSIISSSPSTIDTSNMDNTKLSNTITLDESSDSEEIDHRDLEMYSWRQVLDEARVILDHSSSTTTSNSSSTTTSNSSSTTISNSSSTTTSNSSSTTTSNSSSTTTPSSKRKSIRDTSQKDKYKK
jgi:hypothetical protein